MKLWSLPLRRLACGQNRPVVWFAALLVSALCSLPSAHAGAQKATYFYAGGQKVSLQPASNWSGVQLSPNAKAPTGGSARVYSRRNIVLFPKGERTASVQGVKRAIRVFKNGAQPPIIETDEILVRFKSGVSPQRAQQLAHSVGAQLGKAIGASSPNGFYAYVNTKTTAIDAANALHGQNEVQWSQPNFIWPVKKAFVPTDPLFSQQWHLNNTGQFGGTAGADIKAVQAWDITLGSPGITVAVIDTGIDIDHEDLRGKIVSPRDVIGNDNDPRPDDPTENHGTAIAGLIAATVNNRLGVVGVAPYCKIMPIRLIAPGRTFADEAEALRWATDKGADVINNSWEPETQLAKLPDVTRDAIDYATSQGRGGRGCVVLFAAGNGNVNVGTNVYAASSKVIAVGSSNNNDVRSSFSNFGAALDLVAPGGENGFFGGMTTTDVSGPVGYTDNDYVTNFDGAQDFAGTSAACAVASGVAALVLSRDPSLTYVAVRQRLQDTADKIDPANAKYDATTGHSDLYGAGRINALSALQATATGKFTITGRVVLPDNVTGVQGVLITADTFGVSTYTDVNGDYVLSGLPAGSTNVIADDPAYIFVPALRSIFLGPSRIGVNFIAQPLPKVTLISPPSDIVINTSTYPLSATTANNKQVNRVDFQRNGDPLRFNRAPGTIIPDATGFGTVTPGVATDSLAISQTGDIASISVSVNILHPRVQDLVITLITPDKRRILLSSHGGSGVSIVTTFESVPIGLSKIQGVYQLEIVDTQPDFFSSGQEGTLVSWGLSITPWINIGSDTTPNAAGQYTATWDITATPPGEYLVRAVTTVGGVVQEDIHNTIVIPQPSILLQSPPADSPITGFYTLRAKGTNFVTIKNVEFSQRRAAASFSSGTLNKPIPDLSTIYDSLTVPGGGVAETAALNVDITHQFVGDLKISMQTPDGQIIVIFSDPTNGTTHLKKSFNLPTLVGKAISGKYTLKIEDTATPDSGTLVSWGLTFTAPWVPIGSDTSASAAGIYTFGFDTQSLPGGIYDFRAVATSERGTIEDVHTNVNVISSTVPTYSISGLVKKGSLPMAGVTVTRSAEGVANVTVVTNSSGVYTLPPAPNGDYLVKPSLSGNSFVPFSQKVHIENGDVPNVNFAAVTGAALSGKITNSAGVGVAGITVKRSGSSATQVTDEDGAYHFAGLSSGTYTITPFQDGLGFTPQSRVVSLGSADVNEVNFVTAAGFFIKGRITTSSGSPIANVKVARTSSIFATTNTNGEYTLTGVPNGSFYITPSRSGFNFQPTTRLITVRGANLTGVDFTAVQGVTISGRATTANGSGIAGARIEREGISSLFSTTTDSQGYYSFASVTPGNYIVRATATGYAFSPRAKGVTVGSTTISNLDFQGYFDSVGPAVTTKQPTARLYPALSVASGTASDSASGVAKVTGRLYRSATGDTPAGYWAGGDTWTTTAGAANEILATGTTNWVLNLPPLPTNTYTFRATATDYANNRTSGASVTFTTDTTGPEIQVLAPINTDYDTIPPAKAEGTAKDNQSALSRVTIRLYRSANGTTPAGYWAGGTTWTTSAGAANEILAVGTANWQASLPDLPSNSYTLRAAARDSAGNVAYSPTISFTTGSTAPSASQVQVSASTLTVSEVSASAARDSVTLALGTSLNAGSASPVHFAVEVNGRPVAVDAVSVAGGNIVTLTLPEGSLAVNSNVQVSWSKLQSAQGAALADGAATATTK